jgi:hypothetical protein
MRKMALYAAAIASCGLAVAGCAQAASAPAAGTASSTSTPVTSTTPVTPPTPATPVTPVTPATGTAATPSATAPSGATMSCPAAQRATRTLSLTKADSGRTFCVTPGTVLVVLLQGTVSGKWQPLRSSSGVLAPAPDPRLVLKVGETGAAFRAIRPGTATITSARYLCGSPAPSSSAAAATTSPAMHCDSLVAFRVSVVVQAA